MFRGMTVAEMSPIELYAVVTVAMMVFALSVLGVFQWKNLDTIRQKTFAGLGLFAVWGLPFVVFLNVAQSS